MVNNLYLVSISEYGSLLPYPEYNPNFVLNRGHIMVECLTDLEKDVVDDESVDKVCKILLDETKIE